MLILKDNTTYEEHPPFLLIFLVSCSLDIITLNADRKKYLNWMFFDVKKNRILVKFAIMFKILQNSVAM